MKFTAASLFLTASFCLFAKAEVLDTSEATKAAVGYLKMLTEDKYTLIENTALSEHCELSRRKEIRTQLEFYRQTSLEQGDSYTLEEKKSEGNLAALLLRAENPASPLNTRIHAIAMIKRNGKWLPAPLPGSFSNTGYGYDLKIEQTAQTLERWMAKEKTKRETNAREKASNKILAEVSAREQTIDLNNIAPEKAALLLIEALRSNDVIQTLAVMGATSGKLAESLEACVHKISTGLTLTDVENEWSLVARRSAIVQVMNVDNQKNEVAVGFWDPLAKSFERILYVPFYKHDGKTFAQIPKLLNVGLLSKNERWQQRWRHRRSDENTLRKKLPAEIFKHHQASSHEDKQELFDDILTSHKNRDFTHFVTHLPRQGDYFGKDINQKKCLQELSLLWKSLSMMKTSPMHLVDIYEDDNIALAPLQFANKSLSGEFTTIKIWMTEINGTWHLVSENILMDYGGKATRQNMQKLVKRMQANQKDHQEKQSSKLIEMVTVLTPPLALNAPTEKDAQKTLDHFLTLLRNKEHSSALEQCAVIKGTSNQQTLRIFNYAIRGAADQSIDQRKTLGYTQSGKWTGISLRTFSESFKIVDYPLYLIVNTPKGYKVLLDVDLRYPTNRGRELLNAKAWNTLEEILPNSSLTEIKSIYTNHLKLSRQDIEKNNPDEDE